MEIGALQKWNPVHTDYEWFILHVLLLVLLRVCTEIKSFAHALQFSSFLLCCVPCFSAKWTMPLMTGPHTSQGWVFWEDEGFLQVLACDTPTETLLFKGSLNFSSPLQKPSEDISSPASHHSTGISEPCQEASILSRWRTGQWPQRSHHPEVGPSVLLLPLDSGQSRAGSHESESESVIHSVVSNSLLPHRL